MKKSKNVLVKGLKIFVAILVIVYLAVFIYISINKKSIIQQVTTELGKKMSGKVSVEDVELSFFRHFPKISIILNKVSITDSLFAQHKHPIFQAARVYARLSITKLIKKQSPLNGLTIENGEIYLYTDTSGYTNTYLFAPKKDSSAGSSAKQSNELHFISLKEMSIILDDRKKEKLHNFFVNDLDVELDDEAVSLSFSARADILIHGMAFNLPRGTFLKEKRFTGKFKMHLRKDSMQLQFDSIDIKLAGQPFNLSGRFDLKKETPQFSLIAHTRKILYNEAKSFMPDRIAKSLSITDLDKPLDADVSITGPLNGGEPLIYVKCRAKGTFLKTPFLNFDNASFTGFYTNEVVKGLPRNDPNSIINIRDFLAEWHGLPIRSGNIQVLNLLKPILSCDLVSDFPLTKLNNLLGSNSLQLQSGDGAVNLTYKGPIEKNNNTNSFVNGIVSFKNGILMYAPRNVEMTEVNGQLIFKNSDIFVKDLGCVVLNNRILMQGQAKNLLTFINTAPGKARVDWNISAPSLNLGAFTYLLKPTKKINTSAKNKAGMSSVAAKIDEVLSQASVNVKLQCAALYFKKFKASNVNADVSLLEDKYILNNASMEHAGGNIDMDGALERQASNNLRATFETSLHNVDVSQVLNAFDNFGQDGIVAKNLAGKLTAKIEATMGLTEDAQVLPASLQSTVVFSLKDGALINYEPIKKMQNFLFKRRDFENIRFAELKDTLQIANSDIKIRRMEIQSTVLSFFVEGIYSMKGNTDISIQVPLNNLKRRDSTYNPENIGTQKKAGRSIFLRGRPGSDGTVNFKLDLFNKYNKQKRANKKAKIEEG